MDEDKQQREIATAICRHGKQYDQYCYACAAAGQRKHLEGIKPEPKEWRR